MKDFSLSNALRYVFPSMVVYLYLYMLDAKIAERFRDSLGVLGIIAFVFLGSIAYLLYRPILYDYLIQWFQDRCRHNSNNYRTYLKNRYKNYKLSSHEAQLLYIQIREKFFKERYSPIMMEAAGGIHLLYLAGIIAIIFTFVSLICVEFTFKWYFPIIAVVCLVSGFFLDRFYEDVELRFLCSLEPNGLDSFVKDLMQRVSSAKISK